MRTSRIRWALGGTFFVGLLLTLLNGASLPSYGAGGSPAQPRAVLSACDPITEDTTWAAGLYTATNCAITIPTSVTLTIQPGVTVKFLGNNAVLIVNGNLVAQGAAAQPITFSSVHDNAHGLAAPGSSGAPAAGDWYGIHFAPGSRGQISHAFIGYGTAWAAPPVVGWNNAHIYVDNAAITFANLELAYGVRPGIYLKGSGEDVQITDSTIRDHTGAVSYPGVTAIYQESINMQPLYGNITFSGNTRNEVTIGGFSQPLTQDVTLGGTNFGFVCGFSSCVFHVPDGRTLTVLPDTALDFKPSYGIVVADGGALMAEGTPSQPITFTSRLAADGAANQQWEGLWAQAGSTLRLDHCDISYARDSNAGQGGLEINTDNAVVSNCHIHHNSGTGLYLYNRDGTAIHPTLSNVDVTDNGQYGAFLTTAGNTNAVTWDGGRIRNNGWSGISGSTWSGGMIHPTLRNLSIAENGGAGDIGGRHEGIYWDAHNVNPVLENLTFTGNVGAAVQWRANGSIIARNLSASGNGTDELLVRGSAVGGGHQWDLGDAGIPTRVTGSIELSGGSLLTILPGTTLPFNQYTYFTVRDQAALYALGTAAEPIIFTGSTQEPGWWGGIEVEDRAVLTLNHCEVGYGGYGNRSAALGISWGLSYGVPTANIQNCEIHHSSRKGVHFNFHNIGNTPTPIFRYNSLHDNVQEAVTNWNAPILDARDNYWGDPTGPFHPTQNPGGLGDDVGDNILFYPWLGAPSGGDAPGQMLVSTGAPNLISPGETVDYAIQYLNGMTETVQDAVLLLQLPKAGTYVDGSGGGIYWPQRNQVFWILGDIAPGDQGFVTSRVRFEWGLPRNYRDGSITLLSGSNFNPAALDRAAYTGYASVDAEASARISQAEFTTLRGANPDLESLYQEALGQGYVYVDAARSSFADGKTVASALMSTANRQFSRMISLYDGQAMATTVGGDILTLHDASGGMRFDKITLESTYWGDWSPGAAAQRDGDATNACTPAKCKVHCVGKSVTFTVVAAAAQSVVSWATFGLIPPPGAFDTATEVTKTVIECKKACDENPLNGCCDAEGAVRWSPGIFSGWCTKEYCNATTGTYGTPGQIFCATGTRCVSGTGGQGGCLSCGNETARVDLVADFRAVILADPAGACADSGASGDPCADLGIRVAKDPNDITGQAGDLLPGQTVTYTIRYENEGEGRAYGVYVVNPLPAVFNAGTLTFVNKAGTYLSQSREMVWNIGELGPKGAADSTGTITYTVALTGGLASGTVVANQATVYFSSVPEETPTNTWVNLVSPLVATPQALTTDYRTPLPITLSGKEVSSLPLTYAVVEQPHGGMLSGAAPNLTYTPAENFTGADSFSFTVDNSTSTSRAAQVHIDVSSAGDTTPPTVLWTIPDADATGVGTSASPVFTDTVGPLYTPAILIGVSEALSATTVTTATVSLAGSGGPISIHVSFDAGSNQIVLRPRAALTDGEYTVTVGTGVTDVAGNGLAVPYLLRFTVGEGTELRIYLPAVQR